MRREAIRKRGGRAYGVLKKLGIDDQRVRVDWGVPLEVFMSFQGQPRPRLLLRHDELKGWEIRADVLRAAVGDHVNANDVLAELNRQ